MHITILLIILISVFILYLTSKKVLQHFKKKKVNNICTTHIEKYKEERPYTSFQKELVDLGNRMTPNFIISKTKNDKISVTQMPKNVLNFSEDTKDYKITWSNFFNNTKELKLYFAQREVPDNLRDELFIPSEVHNKGKIENIVMWIGGGDQYTPLHFDHDDGFLSIISGTKRVRLINPNLTNELKAYTCLMYSEYQSIDDFKKAYFEEYNSLPDILEYNLRAGDCLYIPAGWWHDVLSGSDINMAYTIWLYPEEFGKKYDYDFAVKRIEMLQNREIPKFIKPKNLSNEELSKMWKSGLINGTNFEKNLWIPNPVFTDIYD